MAINYYTITSCQALLLAHYILSHLNLVIPLVIKPEDTTFSHAVWRFSTVCRL